MSWENLHDEIASEFGEYTPDVDSAYEEDLSYRRAKERERNPEKAQHKRFREKTTIPKLGAAKRQRASSKSRYERMKMDDPVKYKAYVKRQAELVAARRKAKGK